MFSKTFFLRLILALGLSFLALAAFAVFAVFAQEEIATTTEPDLVIEASELDARQPIILPSNPIYPLKDLWRRARLAVTRDPSRKSELLLRYTNQTFLETQALKERGVTGKAFDRAVENYEKNMDALRQRLSQAERKLEQNPKKRDALAEKLLRARVRQMEAFSSWKERLPDKQDRLEKIEEKIAEHAGDDLQRFDKIRDRLVKQFERLGEAGEEHPFRPVRLLEVIERIKTKLPEQRRQLLEEAKEHVASRFEKRLENLPEEKREQLEEFMERASDNPELRLKIIEQIREKAAGNPKIRELFNRAEGKALERIHERLQQSPAQDQLRPFINDPEFISKRINAAKEAIDKLKELMAKKELNDEQLDFGKRQLNNAVQHLAEAEQAFGQEEYGEAFAQAVSAEQIARAALRTLTNSDSVKMPEGKETDESESSRDSDVERDIACAQIYEPVCGKNGRTYPNACHARRENVEILHRGQCAANSIKAGPGIKDLLDHEIKIDKRLDAARTRPGQQPAKERAQAEEVK